MCFLCLCVAYFAGIFIYISHVFPTILHKNGIFWTISVFCVSGYNIIVKAERKLSHYARKKYIEMGMRKYIEYIKESTRVCRENQYKKRINRLEREIAELRHENYAPDNAEIYNEGIEIFDMTVRTYNVLQRNGLHTVGDIIEADPEKIISIKNLGRKSLEELIEVLKEYGFEAKSMELIRCYENHHLI